MESKLKAFKKNKSTILMAIPIIALCYFIFTDLSKVHKKQQTMLFIENKIELSKVLSNLVHHLQKERGATRVCSIKNSLENKTLLTDQRKAVDQLYKNYENKDLIDFNKIKNLRNLFDQKEETGEKIFENYSQVIGRIIDDLNTIRFNTEESTINNDLSNHLLLVKAKEMMGQIRALGFSFLEGRVPNEIEYNDICTKKANLNTYLAEIKGELQKETLKNLQAEECLFVNRTVNGICLRELNNLAGISHQMWWFKATATVDIFKKLEESSISNINKKTEVRRKRLNKAKNIWVSVLVVLLSIFIIVFFVFFQEIKRGKKAFKRAREGDVRFRAIIEGNIHALILTNNKGEITLVNKVACKQFGYEEKEFLTKKIEDLVPDNILNHHQKRERFHKSPVAREMGEEKEILAKRKKGSTFPVEIGLNPLVIEGEQYILATVQDITQKKKIEKRLLEINQRELKEARNKLVQSEKMASLGTLMAGIAHEINTPLGAIKSSVEGITENSSSYKNFLNLTSKLSKTDIKLFLEMIEASRKTKIALSSRDERKAKKKIKQELEILEVNHAVEIADIISDLHLVNQVEEYKNLILHKDSLEIFKTALEITAQYRNGSIIKIAVDKATKIIFALKSYTHFDKMGRFVESDLVQDIEAIITLYSNQLKRGTEIIKKYDDIPLIKCLPDELGQVWTNLIANGIHAMSGKGTLNITIKNLPKSIKVEIGDSGSGIPEDIAQHIFTPFFTTKPSGEGSGLGLDLVKKIVIKHGGEISFNSKPGNTVFIVEIPKSEHIEELASLKINELKDSEMKNKEALKRKIKEEI